MKKKKLMKKQSCFVVLLMLLLLFPSGAFAQQQMIKGQVVDDKGDTVIGATVMLKGTQEGAITDIDGNFSIKGKVGNTLTISYVGFSPLEVKVTKLEGNRFVLKEDSKVLDEVVVVGMDKQKRNTITAAVATVNEKAIVNRPVTDLTSALQGNVAGLNFASDATASGVGGETGAEIKFNIRLRSDCPDDHKRHVLSTERMVIPIFGSNRYVQYHNQQRKKGKIPNDVPEQNEKNRHSAH